MDTQWDALSRAIRNGFDKKEVMPNMSGLTSNLLLVKEQSLYSLVVSIESTLAQLKPILASNPNMAVADILYPTAGQPPATAREVLANVFTQTARILGRNSPDVLRVDTKVRIRGMEAFIRPYSSLAGVHANWIEREIKPHLDADMEEFASSTEVYHHMDSSIFKKFYQSLANVRRPARKKKSDEAAEMVTRKRVRKTS